MKIILNSLMKPKKPQTQHKFEIKYTLKGIMNLSGSFKRHSAFFKCIFIIYIMLAKKIIFTPIMSHVQKSHVVNFI